MRTVALGSNGGRLCHGVEHGQKWAYLFTPEGHLRICCKIPRRMPHPGDSDWVGAWWCPEWQKANDPEHVKVF